MSESTSAAVRRRAPLSGLRAEVGYLGCVWLVLTALACFFPRTGDDWAWGSRIGITRLRHYFRGYNGRYAGNLAVLVLTRVPTVVTGLVVAGTLTAIVFLLADLSDLRTGYGYTLATALLLAMPKQMWRETIPWLSGFTNYTLAVLCLLVYLRAVKLDWQQRLRPRHRIARRVAAFVFAVTASLFIENVTIYLVLAAVVVALALRIRFAAFSADSLCWFSGFVAGAAIMFSNSAYRNAATAGSGQYQAIHTGIHAEFDQLTGSISALLVGSNVALEVVLDALICVLAARAASRVGRLRAAVPTVLVFAAIAIVYCLYLAASEAGPRTARLEAVAVLLLLAALVACVKVAARSPGRRLGVYALCASIVVLFAPLVSAYPIGPRCFLVTYVVFVLISLLLLRELADTVGGRALSLLAPVAAAAGVILVAGYFVVYVSVWNASQARVDEVRQRVAAGAKMVQVPELPFGDYVHAPDPLRGRWAHRFKLYYHLPTHLKIDLVPPR